MLTALAVAGLGLSVAMTGAWAIGRRPGRSGYIDAIWSAATGLSATGIALVAGGASGRGLLAAAVMALWTLRLAGQIAVRSTSHGDDPRYVHLRAEWGEHADRRLFAFLQAQAGCGLVLVAAVAAAASRPGPLDLVDAAAVAVALSGLSMSAVADRQMERFRASHPARDRIMDEGLWAWSRHPNYVGEVLFWGAWPVLGLGHLAGLAAFAAPALMYWLLRHVSGVPPLEAHLARSRPSAFARYAATVPVFFPISARRQHRPRPEA